jgi:hypothetical protein
MRIMEILSHAIILDDNSLIAPFPTRNNPLRIPQVDINGNVIDLSKYIGSPIMYTPDCLTVVGDESKPGFEIRAAQGSALIYIQSSKD